jgi:hypothetical protein
MKRIDLLQVEHSVKIGEKCEYKEPNVTEDSVFYLEGQAVGFYLTKMPEKMCKLADLANAELRSDNVPKTTMSRATVATKEAYDLMKTDKTGKQRVDQYSTILGGIPPKAQFKRPYPNLSSVHSVKTAQTFIKAMLLLAKESEQLIKEILPEQYQKQVELFKQVPDQWKFGNLFTSSISNYNISAPFHRDTGNILGAVNVIICKKHNAKGGDLHVPDYNATIGQQDNSILVYPAWRNVHGVTPIIPTHEGGYRNSLIFYPLKAFVNIK